MQRPLSALLGCAALLAVCAAPAFAQCPPLTLPTPGCLPPVTAGQPYGFQAASVGGVPPIRYGVVTGALPPGLNLSPSGFLSGAPTTTGIYAFTLQATDSCLGGAQRASKAISLTVNSPAAGLTVQPARFRVPRRTTSNQSLSWSVRTSAGVNATLRSERGQFLLNNQPVGEAPTPVTVPVLGGTGHAQELLMVPVGVTRTAEEQGVTTFTYRRTFSDGSTLVTADATVELTTAAAADLRITRLQLSFDNRRAEITVGPREPGLRAYADLRFSGSGLLRGYWEVDGRVISQVNQHLVYGDSVRLSTPETPALPTFVPGTHWVRLVITEPPSEFTPPQALYYVTAGESAAGAVPIALLAPPHLTLFSYQAPVFRWEGVSAAVTYLLRVLPAQGEEAVASAVLRAAEYTLPEALLQDRLAPGETYRWQVTGLDAEGREVARSPVYQFSFEEPPWSVPGRLLLCTASGPQGEALAETLAARYRLSVVQRFDLPTLGFRVTLVETQGNVPDQVAALAAEPGVLLVQPEGVFRTRSTPANPENLDLRTALGLASAPGGVRGKGIAVAVIDTGVDRDHPELAGRVIAHENLVAGSEDTAELHGTAVAGVLAAALDGTGMAGVAPEAQLIALRACRQVAANRPGGECASSAVAQALDRAMTLQARVVNMSYGTPVPDPLVAKLLDAGAERGVLFVAPVGNRAGQTRPEFPASHQAVIAVAGSTERGAPFPNAQLAARSRVVAPARNLFTTVPGGRYNFVSGTSLAAAQVSGVLALALGGGGPAVDLGALPAEGAALCRWAEALLGLAACSPGL